MSKSFYPPRILELGTQTNNNLENKKWFLFLSLLIIQKFRLRRHSQEFYYDPMQYVPSSMYLASRIMIWKWARKQFILLQPFFPTIVCLLACLLACLSTNTVSKTRVTRKLENENAMAPLKVSIYFGLQPATYNRIIISHRIISPLREKKNWKSICKLIY